MAERDSTDYLALFGDQILSSGDEDEDKEKPGTSFPVEDEGSPLSKRRRLDEPEKEEIDRTNVDRAFGGRDSMAKSPTRKVSDFHEALGLLEAESSQGKETGTAHEIRSDSQESVSSEQTSQDTKDEGKESTAVSDSQQSSQDSTQSSTINRSVSMEEWDSNRLKMQYVRKTVVEFESFAEFRTPLLSEFQTLGFKKYFASCPKSFT